MATKRIQRFLRDPIMSSEHTLLRIWQDSLSSSSASWLPRSSSISLQDRVRNSSPPPPSFLKKSTFRDWTRTAASLNLLHPAEKTCDKVSDLVYSLSLACEDNSGLSGILLEPNAMMRAQLHQSKAQGHLKDTRRLIGTPAR